MSKEMKKLDKSFLAFAAVGVAALSLVSCDDDKDNMMYYHPYTVNAIVTVKPIDDSDCYFQLDDETTLQPINLKGSPYGDKEVRALVNYYEMVEVVNPNSLNIYVNWMDSIRTKSTVPTLGDLNDETYGNDPIEIVNDWYTVAEDGYLTLRFRTLSDRSGRVHYVNLLTGVDENDPYTVELRHDACGDVSGIATDGLIAFNLNELPDTNGEVVKLTLKWKGYGADKSATFDYCTRKASDGVVDGAGANGPIDVESLVLKVN